MTKQTSDALEILKNRYYTTPKRQRDLQKAFVHDRLTRILWLLGKSIRHIQSFFSRFLQRFKC